jgi:hypothetical protein
MTTTLHDLFELRQLDARSGDGISVFLLWQPTTDDIFVRVIDARAPEEILMRVNSELAQDAFQHPFAYAAHLGCTTTDSTLRFPKDICEEEVKEVRT